MSRLAWIAALFGLIALFAISPLQAAPATQVAAAQAQPGWTYGLITDGVWAAWDDSYVPAGRSEQRTRIVAQEIATGTQRIVADDLPFGSIQIALNGGGIAYSTKDPQTNETTITAVDLQTGTRAEMARGTGISNPAVYGNTVYWWQSFDPPANAQLYSAQLTSGVPNKLAETAFTLYGFGEMQANQAWIVSARGSGSSKAIVCYQLEAIPATGGQVHVIGDLGCGTPRFDLSGEQVVYINRDGMLVNENLRNGERRTSGPHCAEEMSLPGIVTHCAGLNNFSSDGRYAFWSKLRSENAADGYDYWGFDTSTGSAFLITALEPQTPGMARPASSVKNGMLIWAIRSDDGQVVLRDLPLGAVLPNAPEQAANGATFFPETRHNLSGEFRSFWERNGGLAVFGYPLSKEFIQESRDDGQGYAVQYFERQRFEFHPENAGTPYNVLIGRMGAEALAAQGIDWTTLPKANPNTAHYFAATGQAIAPEFWNYWRNNGLELGDAAISEREALALWGYPISPPRLERVEGGEILVQWFERARFEYHPNNPEPYNVLLGRLAADQVAGFDWR